MDKQTRTGVPGFNYAGVNYVEVVYAGAVYPEAIIQPQRHSALEPRRKTKNSIIDTKKPQTIEAFYWRNR